MNNCIELSSILQFIPHKVPFASILITFSLLTVLLNSILIFSFVATKQVTQHTSNLLIFFISLSDLATGLIFMPIVANILLYTDTEDICLKLKIYVLGGGFGTFSAMLAVLVAIDRYLHMNPDLHNRQSITRKMFKMPFVFISILVVFWLIMSLPIVTIFRGIENGMLNVAISCTSVVILASLILITVALYTRGYLRIRRVADNNPVYRESGETPEYVRSLYKTVLVLVLLVCVHLVPYFGLRLALMIVSILKVPYNVAIMNLTFEFSLLLSYSSCITSSMAVLYLNKKAKNWISTIMRMHNATNSGSQ